MGELDLAESGARGSSALDLTTIEAPLLLCGDNGRLQSATPSALALLRRIAVVEQPRSLPVELWRLLQRAPAGEAVEWRPPGAPHHVLGCTRYAAGHDSYLLLMREVSEKNIAQSERL
ncbi:MAG TPA: hypothetical protein VHM25_16025, partial [Polyangiaceae bacterium]|nr:hypothetical protein [Polyangiaceae bacterium]